jgi:hypothetical protein
MNRYSHQHQGGCLFPQVPSSECVSLPDLLSNTQLSSPITIEVNLAFVLIQKLKNKEIITQLCLDSKKKKN